MIRVRRLVKSFIYAFRGLQTVFSEEQNIRIQVMLGIVGLAIGFFLKISRLEWCLLIIVLALVVMMEIINSAVERVADVLKPRIDNYVKEIKDITAAAVMLSSILAIAVGVIIFYPYLLGLIR